MQEYVGGYEDWLRQRPESGSRLRAQGSGSVGRPLSGPPEESGAVTFKKLSYREREELDALPARIEALETEQRILQARIAGGDFYKEGADAIAAALARQDAVHEELLQAYARWDELESRPR